MNKRIINQDTVREEMAAPGCYKDSYKIVVAGFRVGMFMEAMQGTYEQMIPSARQMVMNYIKRGVRDGQ